MFQFISRLFVNAFLNPHLDTSFVSAWILNLGSNLLFVITKSLKELSFSLKSRIPFKSWLSSSISLKMLKLSSVIPILYPCVLLSLSQSLSKMEIWMSSLFCFFSNWANAKPPIPPPIITICTITTVENKKNGTDLFTLNSFLISKKCIRIEYS